MAAGFRAYLPDGRLVIDTNSRLVKFRASGSYTVPANTSGLISIGYSGIDAQRFFVTAYSVMQGLTRSANAWVTPGVLNFQSESFFSAGEVIHYFLYTF